MQTQEFYTKEEVTRTLGVVIRSLSAGGLYAPMLKRMRVKVDENVPARMWEYLNASEAPMCTDGQTIGVHTQHLYDTLNEARAKYKSENSWYLADLFSEIQNILIHELTHAICQHSEQGLKFFNERHMKTHQKTLNKELACWNIACEIEANRGYGITVQGSPIYQLGVTDEHYPETKKAKYLLDIFRIVMDKYQDQVADDMQAIMDALKEQAKKEGQKDEGKSSSESKQSSDGESQPSDGSGQQKAEGEGKGQGQSKPDLGGNREEKSRREALMNLIQETMSEGDKEMKPENFDPEAGRNHETIFQEHGCAFSHGGDDIDGLYNPADTSAHTVLKAMHAEWSKENLEKALKKLKGTVVGKVSKNRVATYSRQARRDSSDGLLKKGHKRETSSAPSILLALDKSGSMSHTTTQRATEAVAKIFETTGRPTVGCYICLHDGIVQNVKPMKQWKSVVAGFHPSGGNDFSKVVQLANKLNVDVVLNVGDGGDYTTHDKEAAKAFMKAGRTWYDVNIVGGEGVTMENVRGEVYNWKYMYQSDAKSGGVRRQMIDLTGKLDCADELNEIFEKDS